MKFSEIIILAFICVAILLIIISLIWTKIIKKNDDVYISKTLNQLYKLKSISNNLLLKNKINLYLLNPIFKKESKILPVIGLIIITEYKVFLFSFPVVSKVKNIKYRSGKYVFETKKNEIKLINPELLWFIEAAKIFKENINLKHVEKYILVNSDEFKSSLVNNVWFCKISEIGEIIEKSNNNNNSEKFSYDDIEKIKNLILKKKICFSIPIKTIFEK